MFRQIETHDFNIHGVIAIRSQCGLIRWMAHKTSAHPREERLPRRETASVLLDVVLSFAFPPVQVVPPGAVLGTPLGHPKHHCSVLELLDRAIEILAHDSTQYSAAWPPRPHVDSPLKPRPNINRRPDRSRDRFAPARRKGRSFSKVKAEMAASTRESHTSAVYLVSTIATNSDTM
jgi:hypothetical protein